MTLDKDPYETFEDFLKTAIKDYWGSERSSKLDLVALLLATREAWNVAIDDATGPGKGKTWLKGAAGAAAVTLLLRTVLGGPIGLFLTGASVASLAALYARHHDRIWAQVDHYRSTVEDLRPRFDRVIEDFSAERIDREQRDLMLDGLMMRFTKRLEAIPDIDINED